MPYVLCKRENNDSLFYYLEKQTKNQMLLHFTAGYLKENGNNLVRIQSDSDIYCSKDETSYYQKLDKAFRNQKYYATFTNKQYDSLIILLSYLTEKYNIHGIFYQETNVLKQVTTILLSFKE